MYFQNLNILSVFIVLSIIIVLIFLVFIFYKYDKNIKEKYPLLLQNNSIAKQLVLLWVCISIFSIALLWPSIQKFTKALTVNGLDVMVILDVSKSMNARDIRDSSWEYTRIDTAKSLLRELVINNPENRYWLVVFAWEAVNVSPLTTDTQIFLNFLSWVDYRNVNEQGTDLKAAYTLGLERFINDEESGKALLLLSDWWDADDEIDTKTIRDLLRDSGATNTIIGVGTEAWAKIIRDRDIFWDINYEQFNGRDVVTKLNHDNLEELASLGSWDYYEISSLADISTFNSIFSDIETKSIEQAWWKNTIDMTRYISFFVFFLFLCFLTLPVFQRKK